MAAVPLANSFYQEVIQQVIDNMRQEFLSEGVTEDILNKLKTSWQEKLCVEMSVGAPTNTHEQSIPFNSFH